MKHPLFKHATMVIAPSTFQYMQLYSFSFLIQRYIPIIKDYSGFYATMNILNRQRTNCSRDVGIGVMQQLLPIFALMFVILRVA